MQTTSPVREGKRVGYRDVIREIGGPRRLFHGLTATCWRNGIGVGCYFASYEYVSTHLSKYSAAAGSIIGGSVAGVACWASAYPIDYMKTQIQADLTHKLRMRSYVDHLKSAKLMRKMWTGFWPCVLRSAVVNPFIFLTYEGVKKMW